MQETQRKKMEQKAHVIDLPVIDLTAPDQLSTAALIRQACVETGFFYIVNHGIDKDLLNKLFDGARKFYSLPLEDKMKLARKGNRGYTALYAEKLDPSPTAKGDPKESFYIGPLDSEAGKLNQWPSEELLPNWRSTMETYHRTALRAARSLLSLVALALDQDEVFLKENGFMDSPMGFLRLLRYPGDLGGSNDQDILGASAHSDYGMMALLATDGVPGLQVCRERDREPRIWEDVPHIEGALIVNIGDMMERWTNGIFRSTLHRVKPNGKERYSAPFFIDPPEEFVVQCLETCCSDSNPSRFPPIRAIDYLEERFRVTHATAT
ncbi:azadirone synthase LFS-like [Silene latifolia]|uniref:azadirone synthase LFS-like n=1 Tax=Silene latifolia TaxID=37657 RepID=UPI003D76FBD7